MNEYNNKKLAEKKKKGVNIHLYSDDHPDTTQKGTGFKDAATAKRTLEIIRSKPRKRQVWTVNAMLNRAKYHPHQTSSMREAMQIFEDWMTEYRQEKQGGRSENSGKTSGKSQPLVSLPGKTRESLEREYKDLFNTVLPAVAKADKWPVYLNHCLMRLALDGYWYKQCVAPPSML